MKATQAPAFPICLQRDYELGYCIGTGGFSTVHLAIHLTSFQKVAIKAYSKLSLSASSQAYINEEIAVLRRIKHACCVGLREVVGTGSHLYLVMEYAGGGNLFRLVRAYGPRREEEARELFISVVKAVAYCHSQGIYHRDIKPENVVLTKDGTAKLTDFGFATTAKESTAQVGTRAYMSPELLQRLPSTCAKSDIWGLGVLLHFMLTGYRPRYLGAVRKVQIRGKFRLSPIVKVLLARLLAVEQERRPTAEEVLACAWLRQELELPLA